jgi:hypothetical protein
VHLGAFDAQMFVPTGGASDCAGGRCTASAAIDVEAGDVDAARYEQIAAAVEATCVNT